MTMIFWWRVFDLEFARNNELYEPTGPAVTKIDQLGVGLKWKDRLYKILSHSYKMM